MDAYRYYRIDVSQDAGAPYWCLEELSFYDNGGGRITLNKDFGFAESAYSNSYAAAMAFNELSDSDSSYYCSKNSIPTGWLAYDFQTPTFISKYAMERLNGHGNRYSPVDWTFEGSMDNINWDVLDTQSGENDWEDGEIKEFSLKSGNLFSFSYLI